MRSTLSIFQNNAENGLVYAIHSHEDNLKENTFIHALNKQNILNKIIEKS